jgi:hypothetical protein
MTLTTGEWAQRQLRRSDLGDKRLKDNGADIVEQLVSGAGRTLPQIFTDFTRLKSVYDFFKHPNATPDNILSGHQRMVGYRLDEPGTYLLIEDTTDMVWSGKAATKGLQPLGKKYKGFLLHSVLAVRWEGSSEGSRRPSLQVLGLADQQYALRQPVPEDENADCSWQRQYREQRESQLWETATQRLGSASNRATWIRVCDRGADIYEFLRSSQDAGHHFLVRASQDRKLVSRNQTLFPQARQAVPMGHFDLLLRSRPGQSERTARLSYSAQSVTIQSPKRPKASPGKLPPVPCTVIRVWEADPAIAKPLEWVLLTDQPVETEEAIVSCIQQYASRWLIEEFHKTLKSGLGVEKLQLEEVSRLFAATATMSLAALRILALKEQARLTPEAPAEMAGLDPFDLKVLSKATKRPLRTLKDVVLALGSLGGHLNRKHDGMPGIAALWRGLLRLTFTAEGARIALQLGPQP